MDADGSKVGQIAGSLRGVGHGSHFVWMSSDLSSSEKGFEIGYAISLRGDS